LVVSVSGRYQQSPTTVVEMKTRMTISIFLKKKPPFLFLTVLQVKGHIYKNPLFGFLGYYSLLEAKNYFLLG